MRAGAAAAIVAAVAAPCCTAAANKTEFLWGASTASYQIEGAVAEDGRLPSVWDWFSHTPGRTAHGDTGDVADDAYHRFDTDLALMKALGVNTYRMSIAWTRIVPDGVGEVNQAGVAHYQKLFEKLTDAGITPFATLWHWDTPLHLEEEFGGWLNASMVEHFAHYAEACFAAFGGRVKHWLTLNEPLTVATNGYLAGVHAPGRCSDRAKCRAGNGTTEPYVAAHNMINAHALAARIYKTKFQHEQHGVIGITLNTDHGEPYSSSDEDAAAAQRFMEFQAGWFADPIFNGEYPKSMRDAVGDRLPAFTDAERELLRGSADFYGLNHYTSKYIQAQALPAPGTSAGWNDDMGTRVTPTAANGTDIGPRADSPWLYVYPPGIEATLRWINDRYELPRHGLPLYITENGCDVPGENAMPLPEALNDTFRVDFYQQYLEHVRIAKEDHGVPVAGYCAWSLMDNFEWADGYDFRFGMHHVNYTTQERIPKASAHWYKDFIARSADW